MIWTFALLALLVIGPNIWGLTTIYKIGGYTSEFVRGENNATQVAYNGYSDASEWLLTHTNKPGKVGIVGGSATSLWHMSYPRTKGHLEFVVTTYGSEKFDYDYLVWPTHLLQRDFRIPAEWSNKVVHRIQGGETTYCLIMAYDPGTVSL